MASTETFPTPTPMPSFTAAEVLATGCVIPAGTIQRPSITGRRGKHHTTKISATSKIVSEMPKLTWNAACSPSDVFSLSTTLP